MLRVSHRRVIEPYRWIIEPRGRVIQRQSWIIELRSWDIKPRCRATEQRGPAARLRCCTTEQRCCATEQRCHATEQRCCATEQHCHATKQRCRATEQRCHATKQRCRATEQRCCATKQRCSVIKQRCRATKQRCSVTKQRGGWTRGRGAGVEIICRGFGSSGGDRNIGAGAGGPGVPARRNHAMDKRSASDVHGGGGPPALQRGGPPPSRFGIFIPIDRIQNFFISGARSRRCIGRRGGSRGQVRLWPPTGSDEGDEQGIILERSRARSERTSPQSRVTRLLRARLRLVRVDGFVVGFGSCGGG